MNSLLAELCCLRREVRWLRENLLSVMAAGEVNNAIVYVSDDYTILTTDSTVVANTLAGAVELTLPAAADVEGQRFTIKRIPGAGDDVLITPVGLDTIDGEPNFTLINDWSTMTMRATLDSWIITATANT